MASAAAATVPISEYAVSVVGDFPRINSQRQVESPIASKIIIYALPIKLSNNARLKEIFKIPRAWSDEFTS